MNVIRRRPKTYLAKSQSRGPALWALLLISLVAAACDSTAARAPAATSARRQASSAAPSAATSAARADSGSRYRTTTSGLHYVHRLSGGAREDERLPLIVAIHGLGDRPEHFAGVLHGLAVPARLIFPRGLDPYHGGYSWFPIRVPGPDAERVAQGMRRAASALALALGELGRRYPTAGKPIVTGFSQGGMLSFMLAIHHPERIAAAFPIAGWLPEPLLPAGALEASAPPPIVALHGDVDAVLTVEQTRLSVAAIRGAGRPVQLIEYPGVGHSVSGAMRRELFRRLVEAAQTGR